MKISYRGKESTTVVMVINKKCHTLKILWLGQIRMSFKQIKMTVSENR